MTIKDDIQDFYHCKQWYQNAQQEIFELFPLHWRRFALILAATSPRQGVSANWTKAKKAYNKWLDAGHDADYSDFMLAHRKNLEKIAQTPDENLSGDILSGQKVSAFASNLLGDLNKVTVDMWMLLYYNETKATKKVYAEISKKISTQAKKYNLFPAELQAILWSAVRSRNGHKPATYLIASIDDHQLQFDFMK